MPGAGGSALSAEQTAPHARESLLWRCYRGRAGVVLVHRLFSGGCSADVGWTHLRELCERSRQWADGLRVIFGWQSVTERLAGYWVFAGVSAGAFTGHLQILTLDGGGSRLCT